MINTLRSVVAVITAILLNSAAMMAEAKKPGGFVPCAVEVFIDNNEFDPGEDVAVNKSTEFTLSIWAFKA